ncbi:MAG: alpha/beta hydrolase [Jatrophihabitans sp.]
MVTEIEVYATDGVRLSGRYWPQPKAELGYAIGHGFTGSSTHAAVEAICQRLAGRGAAVVALDFRGHGKSGGLSTIGAVEERDLSAAIAFLRGAGYPVVATAGWSMGGSVVLRHAALVGGVDAVVSVSSPGLWYERSTRSMRRVHFVGETWLGRRILSTRLHTRVGRGWAQTPEAPVEVVGRIAPTPLLIVHGDADSYFPVRHAEALAAAAPGSALWLEHGMGHAENATSPELVDRIDSWVRRVTGTIPTVGVRDSDLRLGR